MTAPIVETKLHIPGRRIRLVERRTLARRFQGVTTHRLTLLSAPPGVGKTTGVAGRPPVASASSGAGGGAEGGGGGGGGPAPPLAATRPWPGSRSTPATTIRVASRPMSSRRSGWSPPTTPPARRSTRRPL